MLLMRSDACHVTCKISARQASGLECVKVALVLVGVARRTGPSECDLAGRACNL